MSHLEHLVDGDLRLVWMPEIRMLPRCRCLSSRPHLLLTHLQLCVVLSDDLWLLPLLVLHLLSLMGLEHVLADLSFP